MCYSGNILEPKEDLYTLDYDLRLAERALDGLLGRGDHEDLLGAIFAGFCIGK
jgi:tRNA U34 5-carboxymethylaminomethyl modifying GTPase MnmE/TrmE